MSALLEVEDLHAYYGKSHILHGVSLHVAAGEIIGLLGRNGVGRSTLCKALMGLAERRGRVRLAGREIGHLAAHRIALAGLGYVPEDRSVFPTLTVEQNLRLGEKTGQRCDRWSARETYEVFPNLAERRDVAAGSLSGGEQQMLSICRSMMGCPDVLLVDEPTEGLSPMMVARVAELLREIGRRGTAILIVEQKLDIVLDISDRVYVMGHGSIVFEGTSAELRAAQDIRRAWLEV